MFSNSLGPFYKQSKIITRDKVEQFVKTGKDFYLLEASSETANVNNSKSNNTTANGFYPE